ncbi:FAR1 DNA-binding domain [Sesbania bispinosa]|nr:FAR1 DNA-binding domain [Sesbania bispinosa]
MDGFMGSSRNSTINDSFVEGSQRTVLANEENANTGEGTDALFEDEGDESNVVSTDEEPRDIYKIDDESDMKKVDFMGLTEDVMRMYHFRTRVVAFNFYNTYAEKKGFAARRSNTVLNKRREVTQQTFVCFKQGYREKKHLERRIRKREPRSMTRCGCFAFFRVRFRLKWEELVSEFDLQSNQWVTELYEKRKMWAAIHIRGNFFAGFRTTSRCEGMHSQVGRQKEVEGDFESIIGEPVLQTSFQDIERCAASYYTKKVFLLFRPILDRARGLKVVECALMVVHLVQLEQEIKLKYNIEGKLTPLHKIITT